MATDKEKPPIKKGVSTTNESTDFSWRNDALCAKQIKDSSYFLDIWFEEEDNPISATASMICFQCPVREECLKRACDMRETEGIWGGLPASERLKRGRAHNYLKLVDLPDPYETTDRDSRFHISNLGQGDGHE